MKPRVTEILRSVFPPAREADDYDLARGSAIHQALEYEIARRNYRATPELMQYIGGLRDAIADLKLERSHIIAIEHKVEHRLYCGRCDAIIKWRGKPCVLELKTGVPENRKTTLACLQVAAYALACGIKQAVIVDVWPEHHKITSLSWSDLAVWQVRWRAVLTVFYMAKR